MDKVPFDLIVPKSQNDNTCILYSVLNTLDSESERRIFAGDNSHFEFKSFCGKRSIHKVEVAQYEKKLHKYNKAILKNQEEKQKAKINKFMNRKTAPKRASPKPVHLEPFPNGFMPSDIKFYLDKLKSQEIVESYLFKSLHTMTLHNMLYPGKTDMKNRELILVGVAGAKDVADAFKKRLDNIVSMKERKEQKDGVLKTPEVLLKSRKHKLIHSFTQKMPEYTRHRTGCSPHAICVRFDENGIGYVLDPAKGKRGTVKKLTLETFIYSLVCLDNVFEIDIKLRNV